jgi:uncharacterized lipoprotein YmbA
VKSLAVAASLAALAACASAVPSERTVLELPPEADVWWFTASGDGHAAWAERRGFDAYLHAGGRLEGPFP